MLIAASWLIFVVWCYALASCLEAITRMPFNERKKSLASSNPESDGDRQGLAIALPVAAVAAGLQTQTLGHSKQQVTG